jgi:peptidoglycan/xylan/chitin deacetylase (PgdA/CDA1 family)
MKSGIKKLIFRAARISGSYSIIRRLKAGPTILFYHGVEERLVDPRVQTLHLPMEHFEKHIGYLRRHFDIVSLDHISDCLSRGHKLDPSQVVLTFDDGYKNNLNVVAPYLQSYDIPFCVFVSTRHISEGLRFPTYYLRASILYCKQRYVRVLDDEFDISTEDRKAIALNAISRKLKSSPQEYAAQIIEDLVSLLSTDHWLELNHLFASDEPMNWTEVGKLNDLGAAIGSHCHDHIILHNKQNMEEIEHQLQTSKALIQKYVGECKYIAYPNGGPNDIFGSALSDVKAKQYLAGLTTVVGEVEPDTNPYALPRVGTSTQDMNQFIFTVNTSFRHNKSFRKWSELLPVV